MTEKNMIGLQEKDIVNDILINETLDNLVDKYNSIYPNNTPKGEQLIAEIKKNLCKKFNISSELCDFIWEKAELHKKDNRFEEIKGLHVVVVDFSLLAEFFIEATKIYSK